MIESTDEMVQAYDGAAWESPAELGGLEMANVRAGLAAVLAVVERDYDMAAVARVHRQFEGRCVECVEWCECANRDDCTHGNVPWPCLTAKVGGFA